METDDFEMEGLAIKALGSLFKITEAHIWDDDSLETCEASSRILHYSDVINSNIHKPTTEFSPAPEDIELVKEMDALGLPVAFQSNKEARNYTHGTKKKSTRLKNSRVRSESNGEEKGRSEVLGQEVVSPTVMHDKTSGSLCCMSLTGQSELYFDDVAVGTIKANECPTCDDLATLTKIVCDETSDGLADSGEKVLEASSMEHASPEESPAPCDSQRDVKFCNDRSPEHKEVSESLEVTGHDGIDNHNQHGGSGDWRAYWDTFYMRNYFHNVKTNVTTWDPPPGMEHLVFDDAAVELTGVGTQPTEMNACFSDSSIYSNSLVEPPVVQQYASVNGIAVESLETLDERCGINICDDEVALQSQLQSSEHTGSCHCELCVKDRDESYMQAQCQGFGGFSTITEVVENGNDYMDIADHTKDQHDPAMKKGNKKARKARARRRSSKGTEDLLCQDTFEEFSPTMNKYWLQRYLLFSRYDDGIKMDEEGWFSVTPEPISRHHASRCVSDSIIDCFAGVGGNAIQFAQRCKHVIAIDIDPKKIDYAHHNASVYEVDGQIDFIIGDFFVLAPKLKADTVFLSPPWGGPDYSKAKTYDIKTMLKPHDGFFLFDTARQIACRIVMFLPRNVDLNQLAELSLSADRPWSLEVEKNFLNGRLKAITAYFSDTRCEALNDSKLA